MADPTDTTSPFQSVRSFFFPQDTGPLNARAMENRRQIALQLMAADARRPYPKTIGEGLSAIGNAIGTQGIMNRLAQQEAAYQKQADAEAQQAVPPEARTTPPPATTSDATPPATPPATPVASAGTPPVVAQDDSADTPATPATTPSPIGVPQAGPSIADATAANAMVNPRVRVAQALMQQNAAQGGPQANPTLGGDQPPLDSPAIQTPSSPIPTAGSNVRLAMAQPSGTVMSDVQPAPPYALPQPPQVQLAQSGPPPALRVPPLPTTTVPQNAEPRMPKPSDIPMSEDEKRGWRIRARGLALGDPDITAQGQNLINKAQQDQKQQYDAMMENYRQQLLLKNQRIQSQEEYNRGGIKQGEADIYARTGLQPEVFWAKMDKAKAAVDGTLATQDAQQLARKAIKDGVITGYGADFKVSAEKFANWALKNGMSGDLAANTEIMRAMLQNSLRQAVATVNGPGGTGVSNADVRIAEGMAGSDPNLQMKTIMTIMDRAAEINNRNIDQYESQVERYLRGHPQESYYQTHSRPIAPEADIKGLVEAQKDPAQAAAHRFYFDRAYGPGAAALEISRAARAERARQQGR